MPNLTFLIINFLIIIITSIVTFPGVDQHFKPPYITGHHFLIPCTLQRQNWTHHSIDSPLSTGYLNAKKHLANIFHLFRTLFCLFICIYLLFVYLLFI